MSQVRAEIIDAQNDMQIRTGIVKEILSAIENLYKVASEREVKKVQEEFYRIFRLNNLYELRRFQQQLDILSEGYRVQSVDTTLYTSSDQ
jgi:putative GTP pyrophosphokinase